MPQQSGEAKKDASLRWISTTFSNRVKILSGAFLDALKEKGEK